MKTRILPIITICFGLLFLLRVGSLSYAAPGETVDNPSTENIDTNAENKIMDESTIGADHSNNDLECFTPELAKAYYDRREAMNSRWEKMTAREAALTDLEKKLTVQLSTLETAKSNLQAKINDMSETADEDISHLVLIYETMKPKKAAEIFNKMDPNFAAGFLRRMNGARAGLIMSEIEPKTSYRISLIIANQNAAWRRDQASKS